LNHAARSDGPAGSAHAVSGIVLLDKPVGLSSNAALQRLRTLYGRVKAGHTGSLDPLASGMLPICLGEATKIAGELLSQRKAYRCTVQLGTRTATGDAEGPVVESLPVPDLQRDFVEQCLQRFAGTTSQIPPMYSALKRDGQPLYKLARQGVDVPREPREITLYSLDLLRLGSDQLELRVLCSKGTYIRVLGEDIARALGTCGHLVALRREFVDPFEQLPLWTLEQLADPQARKEALLSSDRGVPQLPEAHLDAPAALALRQGRVVLDARVGASVPGIRLYGPQGEFMGLGQSDEFGVLRVRRLFLPAGSPAGEDDQG
jgi:tRNA pseudouridine55 synthase